MWCAEETRTYGNGCCMYQDSDGSYCKFFQGGTLMGGKPANDWANICDGTNAPTMYPTMRPTMAPTMAPTMTPEMMGMGNKTDLFDMKHIYIYVAAIFGIVVFYAMIR